MFFKSIIFCFTFFAASYAGWNFSEKNSKHDSKQSEDVKQNQQSNDLNASSSDADSNPSNTTTLADDDEPRRKLQINHKQWAESHMQCSDCHTGAGQINEVDKFSKNYRSKNAGANGKESAFLGVIAREIPIELRSHLELKDSSHGVMIEKVLDESPAFHCGLEEHDILVSIDDTDVFGTEGLSQIIRAQKPKTKISIHYIHHGKVESISLVLGTHKTPDVDSAIDIKGCHAKMAASTNCSSCHKSK